MRNDVNDLKKLVLDMLQNEDSSIDFQAENAGLIKNLYKDDVPFVEPSTSVNYETKAYNNDHSHIQDTEEIVEESLSLIDKEMEMIKKALEKYNGKRRQAAQELGISERTLYRKIKEYNLE
jgi:transcriptional regulator with PAS, ATPase and Fis domain